MDIKEIDNDKSSKFTAVDLRVMKFLEMTKDKKNIKNMPKPTRLRISTRSAISKFSSVVNLFKVFVILSKNIINNIVLKNNPNYLIKCICMSDYSLVTLNNKKKEKQYHN